MFFRTNFKWYKLDLLHYWVNGPPRPIQLLPKVSSNYSRTLVQCGGGAIMLEPTTWPPRSPDLTPPDFFPWGYMQSRVYETPVETQHDLGARIAVAAGTIREMPWIFQRVQHDIARRCRTCNEVGSRHFEQLLWRKTTITSLKTYASSRKLSWPLVPKGSVSGLGCINKNMTTLNPSIYHRAL
jgi:hypothetical protein